MKLPTMLSESENWIEIEGENLRYIVDHLNADTWEGTGDVDLSIRLEHGGKSGMIEADGWNHNGWWIDEDEDETLMETAEEDRLTDLVVRHHLSQQGADPEDIEAFITATDSDLSIKNGTLVRKGEA